MTTTRTVAIRPPSARAEAAMVARAVFHIVYWSALVVSAETYAPGAAPAPRASPFERRFQDLGASDQRLFRALREGILEAEQRRSTTGRWPSTGELARAGVPPFAPDPIDRARHAWTFAAAGTTVNYVGTPASEGDTFLVLVVEPDPGTPPDPQALVDEVHHRLDDGTMIHVAVWTGPGLGGSGSVVTAPPLERGWKQITVDPGPTTEPRPAGPRPRPGE